MAASTEPATELEAFTMTVDESSDDAYEAKAMESGHWGVIVKSTQRPAVICGHTMDRLEEHIAEQMARNLNLIRKTFGNQH